MLQGRTDNEVVSVVTDLGTDNVIEQITSAMVAAVPTTGGTALRARELTPASLPGQTERRRAVVPFAGADRGADQAGTGSLGAGG